MKFIVDAQLTWKIAKLLREKDFDAIHTLNLPLGNATTDDEIRRLSIDEERVVITKDSDFEDSFWLSGIPPKLILVTTGNISNGELLKIFENNFTNIVQSLSDNCFVEIDQQNVIIHS